MVGPGDLEGVGCPCSLQASYVPSGNFRVVTISRSSGIWAQFVCGTFLLEVQKKAEQIFMQPAGTLQQYGITFSPKPEFITQWFSIPKLRNKNCMYVHDDRMVSFSVQNHFQVSPAYLAKISGYLALFWHFINSSLLFSPVLPDVAGSC